jgi:hypothetical protein
MKEERQLTSVKFVSTISKMGDKKIIIIPKEYHDDVEFFRRQIKVTLNDEI